MSTLRMSRISPLPLDQRCNRGEVLLDYVRVLSLPDYLPIPFHQQQVRTVKVALTLTLSQLLRTVHLHDSNATPPLHLRELEWAVEHAEAETNREIEVLRTAFRARFTGVKGLSRFGSKKEEEDEDEEEEEEEQEEPSSKRKPSNASRNSAASRSNNRPPPPPPRPPLIPAPSDSDPDDDEAALLAAALRSADDREDGGGGGTDESPNDSMKSRPTADRVSHGVILVSDSPTNKVRSLQPSRIQQGRDSAPNSARGVLAIDSDLASGSLMYPSVPLSPRSSFVAASAAAAAAQSVLSMRNSDPLGPSLAQRKSIGGTTTATLSAAQIASIKEDKKLAKKEARFDDNNNAANVAFFDIDTTNADAQKVLADAHDDVTVVPLQLSTIVAPAASSSSSSTSIPSSRSARSAASAIIDSSDFAPPVHRGTVLVSLPFASSASTPAAPKVLETAANLPREAPRPRGFLPLVKFTRDGCTREVRLPGFGDKYLDPPLSWLKEKYRFAAPSGVHALVTIQAYGYVIYAKNNVPMLG